MNCMPVQATASHDTGQARATSGLNGTDKSSPAPAGTPTAQRAGISPGCTGAITASVAMFPPFLVVVDDLHVFGPGVGPPEADPPLPVNPDAVLADAQHVLKLAVRTNGCISGQLSFSGNVRAKAGRKGRRAVVAGGQAMTFHEYLSKAVQHDAQQAGERDRLLLVARRARTVRPKRVRPAAPVRRLARLLFGRAPA
jgi:hypothetical protein